MTAVCVYPATNDGLCGHGQTDAARICAIQDQANDTRQREKGGEFLPKFDSNGLVAAIAQDAASGEVLMLAFMDREAIDRTLETGFAHFHSRSRGRLWKKGESSGNLLRVQSIRVDCDQDALLLLAEPAGPACHTGARSCFYRELTDGELRRCEGMPEGGLP